MSASAAPVMADPCVFMAASCSSLSLATTSGLSVMTEMTLSREEEVVSWPANSSVTAMSCRALRLRKRPPLPSPPSSSSVVSSCSITLPHVTPWMPAGAPAAACLSAARAAQASSCLSTALTMSLRAAIDLPNVVKGRLMASRSNSPLKKTSKEELRALMAPSSSSKPSTRREIRSKVKRRMVAATRGRSAEEVAEAEVRAISAQYWAAMAWMRGNCASIALGVKQGPSRRLSLLW
mmetsp:Transcript_38966/g.86700  ORF Transcript_38966/g.86700 Transcript_38966/m.86700 type:complete len:236 (+) Transcript_38966:1657-2364(+)